MENITNVSSEEELLQLRNEGKITEEEYEDLCEALRKTAIVDVGPAGYDESKPVRTSGLAIASLILSLTGTIGCVPAVICGHMALRRIREQATVKGRGLALAGTIVGYVGLGLSIAVIVMFLSFRSLTSEIVILPRHMPQGTEITELKRFPLDDLTGIIMKSNVQMDKEISSDGSGSLRIEATKPVVIRLFETGDIDIENARLIYQARVRTENVEGQVYLEMWCHFAGKGEYFSRGLMMPLTGTTDWTTEETLFFLKKAENPDNVKLNLVINGKGTAWIDDIRLLKGTLE